MDGIKQLGDLNADYFDSDEGDLNDGFQSVEIHTQLDEPIAPAEEKAKPKENQTVTPAQNVEVIERLLKNQGISDPNSLKFKNEKGEDETVSFFNLSVDEQEEILSYKDNSNDLDDEEKDVINYLRSNNLTMDELLNHVREQAVKEYLSQENSNIEVEKLTDDEVYLTDLLSRFKDLSDEEAQQALELEKQNTSLYEKKVNALRENLIEKDKIKKQEEAELENLEKQEGFEQFKSSLVEAATEVKEIGRLELDNDDINEAIEFLLAEDATGTRYIAKALNDPASLIKMSWFYLRGEEAFNYMAEEYEKEIKRLSQDQYSKGYEEGKKGTTPSNGARVVSQPEKKENKSNIMNYYSQNNTPRNIHELD